MKPVFLSTFIVLFTASLLMASAPAHHSVRMTGQTFTLGVIIGSPDTSTLKEQHLHGGAEIIRVLKGSEAERIGLQEHDIITRFNGHKIEDAGDLKDVVEDMEKAADVEIVVFRAGKQLVKTAHLEPLSPKTNRRLRVRFNNDADSTDIDIDVDVPWEALEQLRPPMLWQKGGYLGVEVKDLSDQLQDYFQVKNGVLIEQVIKDSPAQKAGLKAGDVIIKINDKQINDYSDLLRTLNFYDPGDKVTVYFSRKGQNKKVVVTLGPKKGHPFPRKHMRWNPNKEKEYHNFRGPGHIFFGPGGNMPDLRRMFKGQNTQLFAL